MFQKPHCFNNVLNKLGQLNELYDAMDCDDYSKVVTVALKILKKTDNIPIVPEPLNFKKSESLSTEFRNNGNKAFKENQHQNALECYNKALMFAPKNSRAMKLAYSNRSALLYRKRQFTACLTDISTCFKLGCPEDIVMKLKKRKEEAMTFYFMEKHMLQYLRNSHTEFFKFNVRRNPEVPCASALVKIVKGHVPKIVAASDIQIGTVLALEPSFISLNDRTNDITSCYYCHKMSFNLMPCEGCCLALFCSEDCSDRCLKEYHKTECQIMNIINIITFCPPVNLMIKGSLKFVNICESWDEVIEASQCLGMDRICKSSVQEIYDVKNKFSVLSFSDERLFIYGIMYNASFICATIIHYLESVPSFFPQILKQKELAKQALGRIMMYFCLFGKLVIDVATVSVVDNGSTGIHPLVNYGWYPFIGKLENSCLPNTLVVNLNKEAALVAIRPIKKGTVLTTNYMSYLKQIGELHHVNVKSFLYFEEVCNCFICNGDWKTKIYTLTEKQLKIYKDIYLKQIKNNFTFLSVLECMPKLVKVLTSLDDVPLSKQYASVYDDFYKGIIFYTEPVVLNYVISIKT